MSDCVVGTKEITQCPSCGDGFASFMGLCHHYRMSHGGNIMLKETCYWCNDDIVKLPGDFAPDSERYYCSAKCKNAGLAERQSKSVTVNCDYCGAILNRPPCRVERTDNNFCDDECNANWLSENILGENHHRYSKVEEECPQCGNKSTVHNSYSQNHDRVFCSSECRSQWLSENKSGENNPNYKTNSHKTGECEHCGDAFEYRPKARPGRYCSRSCTQKDKTGSEAPNWRGGWVDGDYGPNWAQQRKRVLDRDGWECVRCGMDNKDHRQKFGSGLDVHHIIRKESFRTPDGKLDWESANELRNLVSVCKTCHGKLEKVPLDTRNL